MNIIDITKTLPTTGSNGYRKLADIVYAVVHHSAIPSVEPYDPLSRYVSEAAYHIKKGWRRLSYTYLIDTKGDVYLGNPLEQVAYHSGNPALRKNSIGICLDGDFTRHEPTDAQISSLRRLLDHLCYERPDMPKLVRKTVRYHGEVRGFTDLLGVFHSNPTACPGKPIIEFVKSYRSTL